MSNETLLNFIEEQLIIAAKNIIDKRVKTDEISLGKIDFFIALRSALSCNINKRQFGLIDAVNDTLQYIELIDRDKTFYH